MNANTYLIKVLTNLHAGSGDAGYGVVDKLVQRDAATNLPTIHASGIKGALREYFKYLGKEWVPSVFGDDAKGAKGAMPGEYHFLSADILALPVPTDNPPYFELVYDSAHISKITEKLKALNALSAGLINDLWTDDAASFKEASHELPVIARNHLENGISQNLWYEEVVPHQSVFVITIQYPEGDANITDFNLHLNGKVIQIGGNATVGYGLCLFTKYELL